MTELQLTLLPQEAADLSEVTKAAAATLRLPLSRLTGLTVVRSSIDARQRQVKVQLLLKCYTDGESPAPVYTAPVYRDVRRAAHEVLIVGSGPAGLFAALRCLELGIRPVVLERGRPVEERREDIHRLDLGVSFNPNSNYCFGEGGAGTFSDGKLYSRSNKRGDIPRVLQIFHHHGAPDSILNEAHPHIGSDLLPAIIADMRRTIIEHGGSVRFDVCMDRLLLDSQGRLQGCLTTDGQAISADRLILAIGHSSHSTYRTLHEQGVSMEVKGFAMGVRVEHPQALIDRLQYHQPSRGPWLPAAAYNLVCQVRERGVYSFCMCPGGQIVAASSEEGLLVVNGMSVSRRNSPYANSGIVVEIRPGDVPAAFHGPLAGLDFQEQVEQLAWAHSRDGIYAPAQRMTDFVAGRPSRDLPPASYRPGLIASPLHEWLPEFIGSRLQEGFRQFDRRMHGYLTNQAVVVGVESRSSSPVRIMRDAATLQSVSLPGLYPVGEGAGYAGGITSSALDGMRAVDAIHDSLSTLQS